MPIYNGFLNIASRSDKLGVNLIRISIAIVFIWIGLLKFVPYEADSITPLVAHNPVMRLFYKHPDQDALHRGDVGYPRPVIAALGEHVRGCPQQPITRLGSGDTRDTAHK